MVKIPGHSAVLFPLNSGSESAQGLRLNASDHS